MLVLQRRVDQQIVITNLMTGEQIRLTVTKLKPSVVRIGFDAPEDYRVLREELVPNPRATSHSRLTQEVR